MKIGILGCGAIGSRIARSISDELPDSCKLSCLFDCNFERSEKLAVSLGDPHIQKKSIEEFLECCDLVVEAVNAINTSDLIRQAIIEKKDILAMSVGKLFQDSEDLFQLAAENKCTILVPSGAIAGIDAIKSARLANISTITLTTRKPLSGFVNNSYLEEKGISLSDIKEETIIFEGDVEQAVKLFPRNINVAATLALASQSKVKVRISTSPGFETNSHEIEVVGDFGRILTRTENVVCPDNPKSSYLAVLSGIRTLKDFCQLVKIGT